jgi:hypothetical protein
MPAHQVINIDVDTDICILLQITDVGAISVGRAIDQPQHIIGEHDCGVTDVGIFRETTLEAQSALVV